MSLFSVRKIGIDTYHENIAYLSEASAIRKSEGFGALSKIAVRAGGRSILATLNVAEEALVKANEIGLSRIAFQKLGVPEGACVEVTHPDPLFSVELVRQKIHGVRLSKRDYVSILSDVIAHRYSNIELTAFVVACSNQHLVEAEIADLTAAMIETGQTIDWGLPLVLDKHCIGGVPGNRTTPIVVAIVAALGFPIPKTSSRAITSPSGTADAMATLCSVRLGLDEMRRIVAAENACFAWGGSVDLAPADDILISVERPLNLDSESQMIASILSKKRSAGVTKLLIDLPVGPGAKISSIDDGHRVCGLFERIGRGLGMEVRGVFTDGSQPVGRGIGPALEARDALAVLEMSPGHPADLREKSIQLAGSLLEMTGRYGAESGAEKARQTLESGEALLKFKRICDLQGGLHRPQLGAFQAPWLSSTHGTVLSIHNRKIAQAAKLAGAPQDAGAGLYLSAKVGDRVTAGDPLFTIFSQTESELKFAMDYVAANTDIFKI